jgi:hypothetical protein
MKLRRQVTGGLTGTVEIEVSAQEIQQGLSEMHPLMLITTAIDALDGIGESELEDLAQFEEAVKLPRFIRILKRVVDRLENIKLVTDTSQGNITNNPGGKNMVSDQELSMIPWMFQEIVVEGDARDREFAYAHVCPSCAQKYGFQTSNTCVDGSVCLVAGCTNTTSLVHYIWDYRNISSLRPAGPVRPHLAGETNLKTGTKIEVVSVTDDSDAYEVGVVGAIGEITHPFGDQPNTIVGVWVESWGPAPAGVIFPLNRFGLCRGDRVKVVETGEEVTL